MEISNLEKNILDNEPDPATISRNSNGEGNGLADSMVNPITISEDASFSFKSASEMQTNGILRYLHLTCDLSDADKDSEDDEASSSPGKTPLASNSPTLRNSSRWWNTDRWALEDVAGEDYQSLQKQFGADEQGGDAGKSGEMVEKEILSRLEERMEDRQNGSGNIVLGSLEPQRSTRPLLLFEEQKTVGDEYENERRHRMVATMAGLDTGEEWQDEDFPRLVSERLAMDVYLHEEEDSAAREQHGQQDVHSMGAHSTERHKRKLQAPDFSLSLDQSEGSVPSDAETPDDLDFDVDDLDTPDEAESIDYAHSAELEWENDTPITENQLGAKHPAGSKEDREVDHEGMDERLWRSVIIGEQEFRIDMVAIEPYRKVLSHGGYYGEGLNAIIVFAACFLPDSRQPNYGHIMENLFLYVISTLELLVAENYLIVYLNGATPHRRMPGIGWLKRCYQMIDRKLRKNLKVVLIVHPTWFIRTILALSRPFISSKFYSKIRLVHSLPSLAAILPLEQIQIPDCIWQFEERRFIKKKRRLDEELKEAAESRIQQEEAEEMNAREVQNTHFTP